MRIGIGHDTHRLGPDGPMIIGGVTIEHDRHLIGHSDADVLLHAITDALLGAMSLGEIGQLFPNTADENRDRDSSEFVREAVRLVRQAGYQIGNLDCTVLAQRPKLLPYKESIQTNVASLLGLEPGAVSVKAKTGESVGPIGREEAISAECVVLLKPI